ncbi:MAG: hypothetical protein ABUL58_05485, partial [Steroidobacter sp.]
MNEDKFSLMHLHTKSKLLLLIFGVLFGNYLHAEDSQPLNCDVGPLAKTFGKSSWLVYSCHDDQSLAIVSAPGSPAMPFYFFLHAGRLTGEGTGDKSFTNLAYAEIKQLSTQQVKNLILETQS